MGPSVLHSWLASRWVANMLGFMGFPCGVGSGIDGYALCAWFQSCIKDI